MRSTPSARISRGEIVPLSLALQAQLYRASSSGSVLRVQIARQESPILHLECAWIDKRHWIACAV